MTSTGLSASPQEYRERLSEQSDEQIDAWSAELMRDISIRRGVRDVLAALRTAMATDDAGLQRLFASGGGPPAAVGRTQRGELMVPAVSLFHFVTGARTVMPDARNRLIAFLVDNFHEIIYI